MGPDGAGKSERRPIVARLLLLLLGAATGTALSAYALANVEPLDQPALAALDLAVGWTFLLSSLALVEIRDRRRVAAILAAVGVTWFVGGVFYRGPLVHLLVAGRDGRLKSRGAFGIAALGYLDALIETVRLLPPLGAAVALGTLCMAVLGVRGTHGAVRRTRLILAISAIALVAVLGAGWWAETSGRLDRVSVLVLYDVVLMATAVSITADRRWGGWSRAAVTGLVVDLGDRSDGGTLRDRLAQTLGDPSLVVAYGTGEDLEYIDEAGRPVDLPGPGDGRSVTPIASRGERLGVLIHDPTVLSDPQLAVPVLAAAALAVANARLQSDIRGQTAEVEASRRRLVRAGDRQRRRIERELNHEVISRLDAIDRDIDSLVDHGQSPTSGIATVRETLTLARDELNRFTQGVYPATLAERGLREAIEDLAARSGIPVAVQLPAARLSGEVEATAYFVCAEALTNVAKHAQATRVEVRGSLDGDRYSIAIVDDGDGGADPNGSGLRGLTGRVEGVGGRLRVISPAGRGTRVEAELPLGELGLG